MKEIYTKPEAKIEEFKSVEVLTASFGGGGTEILPGGDNGWD